MAWKDLATNALNTALRVFEARNSDTGESVLTYIPASGATPYKFSGTFDAQHKALDADLGITVSSTNPVIGTNRLNLQAAPEEGDRVNVDGTVYKVVDARKDGINGLTLELQLP
jgi:hypothetical protein